MKHRIADVRRPRTPHAKGTEWPVRVDVHLEGGLTEADVDRWVQSACVLCSDAIVDRYGEEGTEEPERLRAAALETTREGGAGMLRDLQDLYLLAALLQTTWTVLEQAAQGARDTELHQITQDALTQVKRTTSWLTTHMKAASPQVLLVGP